MTFDEVDETINQHKYNLGWASRGDADALAFSVGAFNEVLNDIQGDIDHLRKTYAEPVEMKREQSESFMEIKNGGWCFSKVLRADEFKNNWWVNEDALMRAWLHPEVIKVVE